jgi:O-antigen/teichoic acid export membrane protein
LSRGLDAGTAPASVQRLGQRALSLGAANAIDYATQFLLPIVLARCLEANAFGQYRLLWLAVGTVMAVVTLAMPGSLYYYLPRSDAAAKRLYINQTLAVFAACGLIGGWAVSIWNPWLPEKLRALAEPEAVVPAFVLLWVIASLLDLLPTVEERVTWQARATVGLAAVRAVALSLVAALTGELAPVLLTLLAFVALKTTVLLRYLAAYHGLRGPIMRREAFVDQIRLAAPFWASGALYGLRVQADQWVAAAVFSLHQFASFSVAAVLGPVLNVFRQSVNHAFLPSMSRLQAAGDIFGMLELNSRANVMVCALAAPLLAFAFVFAEEIVTVVYTATYVDAAPVMRVYIAGFATLVVELASVTLLLRQGAFVLVLNLGTLILSLALNWFAARHIGLVGAAVGTVVTAYIDRVATLWCIARRTGVPFRRLQDWRALGLTILFAVVAALFAWGAVDRYFGASAPLTRVVAGSALLAAAYAAMAVLSRMDRYWIAAVREPVREP